MATKNSRQLSTSQRSNQKPSQNTSASIKIVVHPPEVEIPEVYASTIDPTINNFEDQVSELKSQPERFSIDGGYWILEPGNRSDRHASVYSLAHRGHLDDDGTKISRKNRPRGAKPRPTRYKPDTLAAIANTTMKEIRSSSLSETNQFFTTTHQISDPIPALNSHKAEFSMKNVSDDAKFQTVPPPETRTPHPSLRVSASLKGGKETVGKTETRQPSHVTSKLKSFTPISAVPFTSKKIEYSVGAKDMSIFSQPEKQKELIAKMEHYASTLQANGSRRFGDVKKRQMMDGALRNEKGLVAREDDLIPIYESKSDIIRGNSIPNIWLNIPPPTKSIVQSEPPPLVKEPTSTTEHRPWTPKPPLDTWVPPKTTFPSWITTEEQENISKKIKEESKLPCKPRRKPRVAPSCCVLRNSESESFFRLTRYSLRPEIRRWLLGYPQTTRFLRETQDLLRNPQLGFVVHRDDENTRHIYVDMQGPENSLYYGGVFRIEIFFPGQYPKEPPKLRFTTKIYHPGVDKLGRIRLPKIQEAWQPSILLRDVLVVLGKFLREPNITDYIAVDVARRWHSEEAAAIKTAKLWTKKYANPHSAAAWLNCHCSCDCKQLAAAYNFY